MQAVSFFMSSAVQNTAGQANRDRMMKIQPVRTALG
jgi:hypothetical protein